MKKIILYLIIILTILKISVYLFNKKSKINSISKEIKKKKQCQDTEIYYNNVCIGKPSSYIEKICTNYNKHSFSVNNHLTFLEENRFIPISWNICLCKSIAFVNDNIIAIQTKIKLIFVNSDFKIVGSEKYIYDYLFNFKNKLYGIKKSKIYSILQKHKEIDFGFSFDEVFTNNQVLKNINENLITVRSGKKFYQKNRGSWKKLHGDIVKVVYYKKIMCVLYKNHFIIDGKIYKGKYKDIVITEEKIYVINYFNEVLSINNETVEKLIGKGISLFNVNNKIWLITNKEIIIKI